PVGAGAAAATPNSCCDGGVDSAIGAGGSAAGSGTGAGAGAPGSAGGVTGAGPASGAGGPAVGGISTCERKVVTGDAGGAEPSRPSERCSDATGRAPAPTPWRFAGSTPAAKHAVAAAPPPRQTVASLPAVPSPASFASAPPPAAPAPRAVPDAPNACAGASEAASPARP